MSAETAFHQHDLTVGPAELLRLFTRMQRDRYTSALRSDPDVAEIIHVGALSPRDVPEYAFDVDLVVVLPRLRSHTPEQALEIIQRLVGHRVHHRALDDKALRRGTRVADHLVACAWSAPRWPDHYRAIVPGSAPVHLMPAFQQGSELVVAGNDNQWTSVDPRELYARVAERQREWKHFEDLVRMARAWNRHHALGLAPLALEVLVLAFMPRPTSWQTLTRAEALARFFQAAQAYPGVLRRPGHGRVLELGLPRTKLATALHEAAALSRAAADCAADGDRSGAERLWEKLFGPAFGPGWLMALLRWTWDQEPGQRVRADVNADWPMLA